MSRVLVTVISAILVVVSGPFGLAGDDDGPVFLRWLTEGDVEDETIEVYWQRADRGELSPRELVDLGTMLANRGFARDAVRIFRRALDEDSDLYEAWFRIGLVEHREGNLRDARVAYRRCLKILKGHGWCNFFMGRLEERLDNPRQALEHYRRAFEVAPELQDPETNPEVLYSDLVLGAMIQDAEQRRFDRTLPLRFLEPGKVAEVAAAVAGTQPEPESDEAAEGTPAGPAEESTARATPFGTPEPEAESQRSIRPRRVTPAPRRPRPSEAAAAEGPSSSTTRPPEAGERTWEAPRVHSVSPEASLIAAPAKLPT